MIELLPMLDGQNDVDALFHKLWKSYEDGLCPSLFREEEEPNQENARQKFDEFGEFLINLRSKTRLRSPLKDKN